jgi:Mn-dependent DtxR family transcriptional regulator
MVQKLGELGLLNYKKYGIIILSENGKKIGEYLLERHNIIEHFLRLTGCKDDLLQQTELMEHNINPSTVHKIDILINFFYENKNILDCLQEYQNINFFIE